jgi:outer membrane lipoprotein-sorting protein
MNMHRIRIIAIAVTLVMLCTYSFGDDTLPNEVFEKVIAKYRSMETYKTEGTITSDISSGLIKINTETSFSIRLKKPNFYLISWTHKNITKPGKAQSGAVWSDGTQPYLYMGTINAYSKMDGDQIALNSASGMAVGATLTIPSLFLSSFIEQTDPFSRLKDLKIEKTEKIGEDDCYVISGSSAVSRMEVFWVSKSSYLIRKYYRSIERSDGDRQMPEMKGSSTEVYANVSSPELNKSDFRFDVPEGTVFKDSLFGGVLSGTKRISNETSFLPPDRTSQLLGEYGVMEDLDMPRGSKEQPKSDWIESEKDLYRGLLTNSTCDVLIVPFQVQGYAIDRVGRSLMTRYLSRRIESSSALRVSDSTLIARTLGVRSRTYGDREIYGLVDSLKVRFLIRGYVGHNRDNKLMLALLVQEKDKDGLITPSTKVTKLTWKDISFSDEQPPSEAFYLLLDDIMSKLPIPKNRKPEAQFYKEVKLSIPSTITEVVNSEPSSPIVSAYYLQLLGVLYPEDTIGYSPDDFTEREHFFERSLVALNDVSTKSPDYAILKARAYSYLYRRPAAIEVLKSAKTPEEKSLLAFLNGNLPELEKQVEQIASPVHKLIARIELNDLRQSYEHLPNDEETSKVITKDFAGWDMLITRRLQGKNDWDHQANLLIKESLDADFPIPDYTVRSLVTGIEASGRLSSSEYDKIDFSVYEHYIRFLKGNGQKQCCLGGAYYPVQRDYLELLYSIGEANIWKRIRFLLYTQGLREQALETLNRYETLYRGNIKMTSLKNEALHKFVGDKQGQVRDNIMKEILSNYTNVCYWSQGQTPISFAGCRYGYTIPYNGDYPRRWYWVAFQPMNAILDRKEPSENILSGTTFSSLPETIQYRLINLSSALLYTHNSFSILEKYYRELSDANMNKEAKALLKSNNHRFIGNPNLAAFMAKNIKKEDESHTLIKTYKDSIASTPDVWMPYKELSDYYLKQGNFKDAFNTFNSYPLFKRKDRANDVALANYAENAGFEFYKRGAFNEARHFFQLSSSYDTGANSEMISLGFLSLIEGDYQKAASHFLDQGKRYGDYVVYMALLHVMGRHEESWALLDTLGPVREGYQTPFFVGSRMEAMTEEEQLRWFKGKNLSPLGIISGVARFLLVNNLIDRPVNDKFAETRDRVYSMLYGEKNQLPQKQDTEFKLFADGYYFIRKGNFDRAFEVLNAFKQQFLDKGNDFTFFRSDYAVPFFVWSCTKTSNHQVAETYLESVKAKYGEDFYFHIAKAFISGNKGNHSLAIQHLKSAQLQVPSLQWNVQPIFPWYQLVEACETLYEDTGQKEYINMALEWAKVYQKMFPLYAWAYAFEAKWTDSESDRLRALALALYLDKNSERISKFSDSEKARALEWLKKNNPFLRGTDKTI